MPAESVYNHFCRKSVEEIGNFFVCTVCESQKKVTKISCKGGISNFGRHVGSCHPIELSQVKLAKQTKQSKIAFQTRDKVISFSIVLMHSLNYKHYINTDGLY